ncbi:MAG: flavin reductase family protein [Dehalococcoidia bacterium]
MEFKLSGFYEIMSPRCTVLISTVDGEGNTNAAPFSFVTPVSVDPPLLLFAATPARHTLANTRETGDFVVNMVPEELLDKLWVCAKAFPKGVSEINEAGLTERKSKLVTSPSIEECLGWIECRLEFEKEAGDHILVVGRVVHAEAKDGFTKDGDFDVPSARPVMHIRGRRFVAAERIVQAPGPD